MQLAATPTIRLRYSVSMCSTGVHYRTAVLDLLGGEQGFNPPLKIRDPSFNYAYTSIWGSVFNPPPPPLANVTQVSFCLAKSTERVIDYKATNIFQLKSTSSFSTQKVSHPQILSSLFCLHLSNVSSLVSAYGFMSLHCNHFHFTFVV